VVPGIEGRIISVGMVMGIHSGDVMTSWRARGRVVVVVVGMGWRVKIQTAVRVPSGHSKICLRAAPFLFSSLLSWLTGG